MPRIIQHAYNFFSSRTPKHKLWIFSSRTPNPKFLTVMGTDPRPRIRPLGGGGDIRYFYEFVSLTWMEFVCSGEGKENHDYDYEKTWKQVQHIIVLHNKYNRVLQPVQLLSASRMS